MKKKYVSYKQYGKMIEKLTNDIKRSEVYKMGQLQKVMGFPRGGLPIAVHLSHNLNLSYCHFSKTYNNSYLIVDDISDTGKTLYNFIKPANKLLENVQVATLFMKQHTKCKPDFFVETINNNVWVVFPWEKN